MDIDATRQRILGNRVCYTCGETGHLTATCPSRQRQHLRLVDMTEEDFAEIAEVFAAYQDTQALLATEEEKGDFVKNQE
jgi:hypothetical protein